MVIFIEPEYLSEKLVRMRSLTKCKQVGSGDVGDLGMGASARRMKLKRYRDTSPIRNNPFLGPCSRTMSSAIWWP